MKKNYYIYGKSLGEEVFVCLYGTYDLDEIRKILKKLKKIENKKLKEYMKIINKK